MIFDLWRQPGAISLELPSEWPSVVVLSLLGLLYLLGLWARRRDFSEMRFWQWVLFLVSLGLIMVVYPALQVRPLRSWILPFAPGVVLPYVSVLSLPAFALVGAVAIWLGPGPALLANLLAGVAWSRFAVLTPVDLLAFCSWGLVIGAALRQPYRGRLFDLFRCPLVAAILAALVTVHALWLTRLAVAWPFELWLTADSLVALWNSEMPVWFALSGVVGIGAQVLFLVPRWRPRLRSEVLSIYSRSLGTQILLISLPLVVLSTALSVFAVMQRALQIAIQQSIAEMHRNAVTAGEGMAYFQYTGQHLLSTFAQEPMLLDPQQRTYALMKDREIVPFFQELLVVSPQLEVLDAVPVGVAAGILTSEEEVALERVQRAARFSDIARMSQLPSGAYVVTFVEQVFALGAATDADPAAYLLGRVELNITPEVQRALSALQSSRGNGTGFVTDRDGLVIAHPDLQSVQRPWAISEDAIHYPLDQAGGSAYRDVSPDGAWIVVYVLDVPGTSYRMVQSLPYSAVLATASAISRPLLIVQIAAGALFLVAIPLVTTRVVRRLNRLAEGARQISSGNLSVPMDFKGEDEIAQLGNAFDQMRIRLQARLRDLSLLLSTAQQVSAALDLEHGVAPILDAVLEETGAKAARLVLLAEGAAGPRRVFAAGVQEPGLDELDRAFVSVVSRRPEPVTINDLHQTSRTTSRSVLRSVAVVPVNVGHRLVAMLWVGDGQVAAFDEARIGFLSTLATQAAVLLENVRLFQAAEGGRRRLQAILASTGDAILVVDSNRNLLLMNPAAQQVLGLAQSMEGEAIERLPLPDELLHALMRLDDAESLPAVEVPVEDGRTFYASVAPVAGEGEIRLGSVAVLRDVTHFKELDEMKSDFVSTVSHDLRAPLTYIRGYATMLMMVGDLNSKQQDYVQRMLEGIEQMSSLITDLLNLRRIEAGVGVRQEPFLLGLALLETVDTMRSRAGSKGIALRLLPSQGSPVVVGDSTLLRQAMGNLIDNAIKYTPSGGMVTVSLEVADAEALIRVSDTGIGIAPEDQVRLFEKFHRVKRRETGSVRGTGLGLALVKSIVDRHKGHVWVESILNQGSTFTISLPLPADSDVPAVSSP